MSAESKNIREKPPIKPCPSALQTDRCCQTCGMIIEDDTEICRYCSPPEYWEDVYEL